jgi:hypothetical protein
MVKSTFGDFQTGNFFVRTQGLKSLGLDCFKATL